MSSAPRPVSRGVYAAAGITLFFLKFNLDRLILHSTAWSFASYLYFLPGTLTLANTQYTPGLLALALPFVAVGVWLTLGRLREIGWPAACVGLFFLPFVNLLFFVVLCVMPGHAGAPPRAHWLDRFLPESRWGSAAVGVLIAALAALCLGVLLIFGFQQYALGLFVGMPFMCGFFAAWAHSARQPRGLPESIGVSVLSVIVLGLVLFGLAVEGAVCLMMAMPFGLALGCLGGVMAHLMTCRGAAPMAAGAWLLALPVALAIEFAAAPRAEVLAVTTTIDVAARPETVWRNVVSFPELAPPTEWYFQTGIAYPVRARIEGSGTDATRHCEFSTGAFVEPITVWDQPRRLRFGVTSSPAPMHEWTPYGPLANAPHLHGFFEAVEGEFRLEPLAGGGTRLHGTTWYRHRIWPAPYWRLWSDAIVHRIHLRVLRHIRARSEPPTPSRKPAGARPRRSYP